MKYFPLAAVIIIACATPHAKPTIDSIPNGPETTSAPSFMSLFLNAKPPEPVKCEPVQALTDVDEEASDRLVPMLKKCAGEPVTLEVDSGGGNMMSGYEIVRAIEKHGNVTAKIDGICASMCLAIVQSAKTRLATSRSSLMAHMPASGGMGKEVDMQNVKERLRVMGIALAHQYCHRSSLSFEACKGKFAAREWWMTPDEALADGLIDATY